MISIWNEDILYGFIMLITGKKKQKRNRIMAKKKLNKLFIEVLEQIKTFETVVKSSHFLGTYYSVFRNLVSIIILRFE